MCFIQARLHVGKKSKYLLCATLCSLIKYTSVVSSLLHVVICNSRNTRNVHYEGCVVYM